MIFPRVLATRLPVRHPLFGWIRLSTREQSWKSAEILLLRHQLKVLQRHAAPARSRVTWADRALLAALLGVIPRSRRAGLAMIVTPETMLRWHRDIVRQRWAAKSKPSRPGRPPTHCNVTRLVLRLALKNPTWGYRRIHGELAPLGVTVAPSTVWEILHRSGIAPAPRRTGPTWAQFLHGQAAAILATDFFHVDLLDGTTDYVLTVVEHATRRIQILGVTAHPDNASVTQQARNLLMDLDGHLESVKFLLRDRDTKFTAAWDAVFTSAGIKILRKSRSSPTGERDNGTVDRLLPPRTAGPDADLEPTPPAPDTACAPDPPQRASTAPLAPASCAAQTATRAGSRSRRGPGPPT